MAISGKSVGQSYETRQDTEAKRKDLQAEMDLFAPEVLQDEGKGQDAPTSFTEQEMMDLGLLDGAEVITPVEGLGISPQDQLESAVATTEVMQSNLGVVPGTSDSVNQAIETAGEPLTEEQQNQMESERVPSIFEANGIATDMSNLSDAVGTETANRFRTYVSTPYKSDPINMTQASARAVPLEAQVGSPEFEDSIEAYNKSELDKLTETDEKPLMMRSDNSSLVLSPQNLFTSNKALGKLSLRNSEFDAGPEVTTLQPVELNPRHIPLISMIVEDFMVTQDAVRARENNQVAGLEDEVYDPMAAEKSDVSMSRLGRDSFTQLRRAIADIEGDSTDSYMEDYRNLTPESFELIGKGLMAYYQSIAPRMVSKVNTGATGGESQFVLTPFGRNQLEAEAGNYRLPDFKKDFLYIPAAKGKYEYEGSMIPTKTGSNPNSTPRMVKEAVHNSSQVRNYLDTRRATLYVAILSSAVATNPVVFGMESANFTHNLVEQGQQRITKITNGKIKQDAKLEKIDMELQSIRTKKAKRPKNMGQLVKREAVLQQEREAVSRERVKYIPKKIYQQMISQGDPSATPELLQIAGTALKPQYFSFVNKNMEVGSMLSRYKGVPFYHTFNEQTGTHRLNAIQNNNFQTNHAMRAIIGSGVKYVIKPGSNSTQERALLRGFASLFFGEAGSLPDTQLRSARDNINTDGPRYKAIVNLGNKLIDLTSQLNPKGIVAGFAGLQVTPKGIDGVDRISDTSLLQIVEKDPELKALFEQMASRSDSHKHTIQMLDYMMALADYDTARKEGKPFHSSVNAIEIDGISNGLTTMQAMLGNINAMYRGGILRVQGEEKILGMFKDIESAEAYRGKLRDSLRVRMEGLLNGTFGALSLTDNKLMKRFNYTQDDMSNINNMISLAVSNTTDFLKPPLMTFPYGQELRNLIGSVYATIIADPELRAAAEEFGGIPKAAEFLNAVREPALIETLGADLVAFATMTKEAVNASAMFGLPIETVSPVGGVITFGGSSYVRTGKAIKPTVVKTRAKGRVEGKPTGLETKVADLQAMLEKATAAGNMDLVAVLQAKLGSGLSGKVTVAQKYKRFDVTAERGGRMGAVASGQILPSLAQSVDGSTIAQLFSNESMAALKKETGGDPYILPIFDAVITDLGSFEAVERKINQIFYRNVTQSKMLDGLDESLQSNLKVGYKTFRDLANRVGSSPIDEVTHGGVADLVVDMLEKNLDPKIRETSGRYHISKLETSPSNPVNPQRTYKSLFEAQRFLMDNLYSSLGKDFNSMVKEAKHRNKQLQAKVEEQAQLILQYEMDGFNVDFLDFLPPLITIKKRGTR